MRKRPGGYILAGGESTRFGRDKARALLDGVPLVVHVARSLERVTQAPVTVVSTPGRSYEDLDLRTIYDRLPGLGPIGGVHAALSETRADPVVVASCDLARLEPSWIETLVERSRAADRAAAYRAERWHPGLTVFRVDDATAIASAIEAEERAMWKLLDRIDAVPVAVPTNFDTAGVNTPERLRELHDQ